IHVKADAKLDPLTGEAPLEVSFTDQSVRGDKYVWNFGDGTKSESADPEIHTYYKTGLYYPKLEITSALGCVDSVHLDSIYVEPSKLDIPNTFTPNGDTWNDFFKVESKSLRFVSMEIFSQSGQKVYGFSGEGESLQNWQGWDGKINNTSVEARPGIYYYIIRAFGWDDVKYDSSKYRGFVYLYR
ncbi:MAG: gliding motility-associated C-terminal domain-containing protein, partial [Bacteroidia bacterium]|nr:gliding motility-associated C-terminal domain-containing protein [Bacteroidia bacterium]